jgi:hypothetical protein
MTEWLSDNWPSVVAAALAIHAAAVAVVNLTPTKKDDEAYAKLYRWIEILGGIVTKKAKE